MVVGRENGVIGLTELSDKKMGGPLFGPQTSGHNSGVVVLWGWSNGGVPLWPYLRKLRQRQLTG